MSAALLATVVNLQAASDLLAQHPTLPEPYVTVGGTECSIHWFMDLDTTHGPLTPEEQHAAALRIFDALGGTWEQTARDLPACEPTTVWTRRHGAVDLHVEIARRPTSGVGA